MNITIFGGSQPKEGDAAYAEAYELGKLLAKQGHTVLTGGYIGTMEAVSRGAAEAGGHVIGVTCADIEAWRPVKPNAWMQEERRFATIQERLNELVLACDAAIALPGGPGTLTEIALTWNLMIVNSMPAKPLILTGAGWMSVMESFYTFFEVYIPQNQRDLLQYAPDIEGAVKLLSNHH
ncbi:MAG: LOG family protein [Anaerolineales bacterium]